MEYKGRGEKRDCYHIVNVLVAIKLERLRGEFLANEHEAKRLSDPELRWKEVSIFRMCSGWDMGQSSGKMLMS